VFRGKISDHMEVFEKADLKFVSAGVKKSILIVDDSDLVRERIAALCSESENAGTIYQAKDSEEAYKLFNLYSPELVILDLQIPGDNGIKVLENLRKQNRKVKIVILTNYPYDQYRKRCMELGAEYFLEKSPDMNRIPEICNELVIT
jgi:DNA-binding NarL/FixJ family response regulator